MATKFGAPAPAPSDAKWKWISPNNLDIQKSGEWAVKEYNRKHGSDLQLNAIDQSWVIALASDYGNLYLLHLRALKGTELFQYEIFVWAKPADCHDCNTLVSFKEVSPASASA